MKSETDDKYLQIFEKCIKMQLPNSNYYNYHRKPVFKNKLSVVQNEAARQVTNHTVLSLLHLCALTGLREAVLCI